jgi:hypothetical protein
VWAQSHRPGRAVYMVTSANTWPRPLTRALFEIRHPEKFQQVRIAYPSTRVGVRNGKILHRVALQPFAPDKEMTVTWKP